MSPAFAADRSAAKKCPRRVDLRWAQSLMLGLVLGGQLGKKDSLDLPPHGLVAIRVR